MSKTKHLVISSAVLFVCVFYVDGLVLSTVPPPPVQYRRDYVYLDGFNEFVKVNLKQKTWQQAKATCENEGAGLAVIKTTSEAEAIKKLLESLPEPDRNVWIGLQDIISEGEFETVDGESILSVFGKWQEGEPNNYKDNEDCVVFTQRGLLNDVNCAKRHTFLCIKDAATVTPNEACDNFDIEYKQVLDGQQCIKFHSSPKNWEDAYATCIAEQSHLAIINSQEEADLYKDEFAKYPASSLRGDFQKGSLLLGFHDKFTEGDYVTISNQKLSDAGYEVWGKGQPDNKGKNENCGSMFRDGKLNDINCNRKAMFICEKNLTDPLDVSIDVRLQDA